MGLLRKLVAWIKPGILVIVIDWVIDWVVVLIGAFVFFGTLFVGSALFGETVGFGIGIGSALLAAFFIGPRLRKRLIDVREDD
ncbi:hypothetical protein U4E84_05470 [Halorubrum sp. AD140]|uniref:hypothetical protein n=1 Tax=Halorubrum sp. AD140 TaxID=3050073 RepID=UPI002ACC6F73|nr:hypothetical protein [Halorubrum sp. AD140]MDZ5810794.1 hypothetical protein [Halorubrum sp. AD140]